MYIQVEIKEGSIAFGVCEVEFAKDGKTPIQNLILGKVSKIVNNNLGLGEREITITTDAAEIANTSVGGQIYAPVTTEHFTVTLPEWRVSEFDFGGVPLTNPWFDSRRIEKEDTKKLGFNPHQMVPVFP